MPNAQNKLKIKLLVVQLLSILPFLIFIFYLFDLWYDVRRTLVLEKSMTEVKQTSEQVNQLIRYAKSLSMILSTDEHFYEILIGRTGTAQKTIANIIKNAPEIENIVVINDKGYPTIASFELTSEQKQMSASDRAYFQKVLTTGQSAISEPVIGKLTGKSIIIIASPIMVNGKVVSVVTVSFNLEKFGQSLDKIFGQQTGKTVFVLDNNNHLLYASDKKALTEEEEEKFANLALVEKIRREGTIYLENEKLPTSNQTVIGAGVWLEELNWVIISSVPVVQIFAPLFKVQSLVWWIIFIGLIFSISVITYFLRKVRIVY